MGTEALTPEGTQHLLLTSPQGSQLPRCSPLARAQGGERTARVRDGLRPLLLARQKDREKATGGAEVCPPPAQLWQREFPQVFWPSGWQREVGTTCSFSTSVRSLEPLSFHLLSLCTSWPEARPSTLQSGSPGVQEGQTPGGHWAGPAPFLQVSRPWAWGCPRPGRRGPTPRVLGLCALGPRLLPETPHPPRPGARAGPGLAPGEQGPPGAGQRAGVRPRRTDAVTSGPRYPGRRGHGSGKVCPGRVAPYLHRHCRCAQPGRAGVGSSKP